MWWCFFGLWVFLWWVLVGLGGGRCLWGVVGGGVGVLVVVGVGVVVVVVDVVVDVVEDAVVVVDA